MFVNVSKKLEKCDILYIFLAVKIHLLRCLRKCNLTFNLLFQQPGTQQCRHFSFWNPWTQRIQTRRLSISGFHPEKSEYTYLNMSMSSSVKNISLSVSHLLHRNSLLEVFPIIPKVEQNPVCFNILTSLQSIILTIK